VRIPLPYALIKAPLTYVRFTITSSTPSETAPAYALLNTGAKTYQMRQKNTSNPIMIIQPSSTGPTEADDATTFISQPSICSIAKIEDTIELIAEEPEGGEKKAPPKVNKWHAKFAKSRVTKRD
jgi:sister chromatid cohesion protein DCC1